MPDVSAATDAERLDWIEQWAKGWREVIDRAPEDYYYTSLALDAACDMLLELTETLRDLATEVIEASDLHEWGDAVRKARAALGEKP